MYLQYKTIKEAALLENNTMVVLYTHLHKHLQNRL